MYGQVQVGSETGATSGWPDSRLPIEPQREWYSSVSRALPYAFRRRGKLIKSLRGVSGARLRAARLRGDGDRLVILLVDIHDRAADQPRLSFGMNVDGESK